MKNLFFIITAILIMCIGTGEGFAMDKGKGRFENFMDNVINGTLSKLPDTFFYRENKSWLRKNAPMSKELYQYLKSPENNKSELTWEEKRKQEEAGLQKIVEKHMPIGITLDEALKIAKRNRFKCEKVIFKNISNKNVSKKYLARYLAAAAAAAEHNSYGCVIDNFLVKKGSILVSDTLHLNFRAPNNKITSYSVGYQFFAP